MLLYLPPAVVPTRRTARHFVPRASCGSAGFQPDKGEPPAGDFADQEVRDESPVRNVLVAGVPGDQLAALARELAERGLTVRVVDRVGDAEPQMEAWHPVIVLLSLEAPDVSGVEVMHELLARWDVPVILLSRTDDEVERIRALDGGADDVIAQPFSARELAARIRAVLRRTLQEPAAGAVIRLDGVRIDTHRHIVTRDGIPVRLTRTEWMLLDHFINNMGNVILSRDLLTSVWGPEYASDLRYLRVWISRLRHKIEPDPRQPRLIRTYAGMGYMLDRYYRAADVAS